jgi:hypothetical protein
MCSVPICVTADTKAVGLTGHQSNLQHAVHASAANRVVTWSARPFTLRSLACASNMNVSIASFPFGERPPSITRVGLFADRTRQKLISQRALRRIAWDVLRRRQMARRSDRHYGQVGSLPLSGVGTTPTVFRDMSCIEQVDGSFESGCLRPASGYHPVLVAEAEGHARGLRRVRGPHPAHSQRNRSRSARHGPDLVVEGAAAPRFGAARGRGLSVIEQIQHEFGARLAT